MLAVSANASQPAIIDLLGTLDACLMLAGAAVVIAWMVAIARSGRWRDPLAGVGPPADAPSTVQALVVVALFYAAFMALTALLLPGRSPQTQPAPGSRDFHMLMLADAAAKLIGCAAALAFLAQHPAFRAAAGAAGGRALGGTLRAWRPVKLAMIAVAAALATHALTTTQLQFTTLVWKELNPGAPPPVHGVLEALVHSEWGVWGALQLFAGATVVAPLAEEVFFRGLVLQCLWRYTGLAWASIAASALLFGLVHISQPQDVAPLATMGLILGYLRIRHRSLALCVSIHMLFNARTMIFAALAPELVS